MLFYFCSAQKDYDSMLERKIRDGGKAVCMKYFQKSSSVCILVFFFFFFVMLLLLLLFDISFFLELILGKTKKKIQKIPIKLQQNR